MKIKPGANYDDLTPAMKRACSVAENAFNAYDYILVLTSGRDSVHGPTTLHGDGNAGDFRTRQIRDEIREQIVSDIRRELGKDFDVILESDHLHIEHDPKG
jgi:hypothetical protein